MVLQAMVNYVDGDPDVDRMWIYTDTSHEAIETIPFFRFQWQVVNHGQIGDLDNSREYDQWELLDQIDVNVEQELISACREAGAVPERIITVFKPESVNSTPSGTTRASCSTRTTTITDVRWTGGSVRWAASRSTPRSDPALTCGRRVEPPRRHTPIRPTQEIDEHRTHP